MSLFVAFSAYWNGHKTIPNVYKSQNAMAASEYQNFQHFFDNNSIVFHAVFDSDTHGLSHEVPRKYIELCVDNMKAQYFCEE